MKRSDFIFDSFNLLNYKCHKINLKRIGSNKDSFNWIKNKKSIINPVNDNGKCFQYAVTVALNHGKIGIIRK